MADVILKAEKDFTKEVDAAIPEAEALGKVSNGAQELLLILTNRIFSQMPRLR